MLYRKVKCSDRLPDRTAFYNTELGLLEYDLRINTFYNEYYIAYNPRYWFEEVKEPTDKEITNLNADSFSEYSNSGLMGNEIGWKKPAYNLGFSEGFEKALELLTGK